MTEVTYEATEKEIKLTVKGHADAGVKGKDLVCAGISTLVYMVANSVQIMFARDMLKKRPFIEFGDGETKIIVTPKKEHIPFVYHTFWDAGIGFSTLSHSYPNNVNVNGFGDIK